MTIIRFDSPAALAAAYRKLPEDYRRGEDRDRSWIGGSALDAAKMCSTGDDRLVAEAEKMLDLFQVSAPTLRPEWSASVFGAYPMVPDALGGNPESMRRLTQVGTDFAPIRLFIATTSSGGINHEQLTKRGTALLALTMILSAIRPVELYAIATMEGDKTATRADKVDAGACLLVTRINSQPLDLATACHVLTSVALDRGVTHKLGLDHGFRGGWSWGMDPSTAKAREKLGAALDATHRDIVVPGAWLYDQTVTDPIGYVRKELREFEERNQIGEEFA